MTRLFVRVLEDNDDAKELEQDIQAWIDKGLNSIASNHFKVTSMAVNVNRLRWHAGMADKEETSGRDDSIITVQIEYETQ